MDKIQGQDFSSAWMAAVGEVKADALETAAELRGAEASLQSRITAMQAATRQRHALADVFGVSIQAQLTQSQLSLLSTFNAIAPGAELPPDSCDLVRVSQQLPGQSAKQMRAYVTESAPSNDESVCGRFDRLQAARLYMGCTQFGYFLATIFLGQADLDPEAVLTPTEARLVQESIQRATREMRTEAAWATASRRAGALLGLPRDADDEASWGYEALREFTVGVQVVGAAQQEEFFASGAEEDAAADSGGDAGGSASGVGGMAAPLLPSAEFVRFNAKGLQCMLAEGCFFGWCLWRAESEAIRLIDGTGAEASLLMPPSKTI